MDKDFALRLKNITFWYKKGKTSAKVEEAEHTIKDFSLDVEKGSFTTLLGPSGCGKTTLLRLISGFLEPQQGEIELDGVNQKGIEPNKRKIGMVFQDYALFPHMTVRKNIEFGLKLNKDTKAEADKKISQIAETLNLEDLLERYPDELSGGQQQRVAIARTLAPEPTVLFMDEPLSNLDAKLRLEMRYELQRLHIETGSTFVYVTHDQMEAMTLATKICLINNGVLQQYDAPLQVYNRPNNLFVADFVGNPSINFIEAKGEQLSDGKLSLEIFDGKKISFSVPSGFNLNAWYEERDKLVQDAVNQEKENSLKKGYVEKQNKDEVFKYHIARLNEEEGFAAKKDAVPQNGDFVLAVRPEFIQLAENGMFTGEICGAMPTGMESTIKIGIADFLLTSVIFGGVTFQIGSVQKFNFIGEGIMLFDRKSGRFITHGKIE